MADNAKKTEHAGARKSSGAFYGPKAKAKKGSNRCRREGDKRATVNHGNHKRKRPTIIVDKTLNIYTNSWRRA